jgi:uncharacterized membrane protein YuzA (DUF378 family)
MKVLHTITFSLLVIGGLNWGLTSFGYNVVEKIFGPVSNPVTMIIYLLVGVSALVQIFTHKSYCKYCNGSTSAAM